ncbi:MAG TPA: S9 family peptidase [Vicinamibacterales bacterium]|jgi:dipeptidyl aminopeptidase/acylaminoacyl peptidase|nr:S9 family peptidase [Vicinamibacterales bacterium]
MKRAVFGVMCALAAAALHGQAKRPLAIEDYYRVLTIGNPQISSDGKSVQFTVATRVEDDNSTKTDTFRVPTDASAPPEKIEAPPGRGAGGGRGGGRGGRGGGGATAMSPDGAWIVRTQEKPEAKAEPNYASDFEKRHQERFKGVQFDWKDFQRDGAPYPVPNPAAAPALQVVLLPAAGGDAKVIVDKDLRPSGLTWHPTERLIAFTADADFRDELKYDHADLWTSTTNGTVTRLTNDGAVYSDPAFSPDGKYLAYERSFGTDMIIQHKLNHGGPRDLYIRPVAGGQPINLTAAWDLEPGPIHWSPDSRFVYFTAEIGGESHLFRVAPVAGARVEQVTTGPRRIGNLTIDKAFTTIAYTVGQHDEPGDLYAADIDGSHERRLTDVNHALMADVALSKAERLQWKSYDGTPIEGWILPPANYDPSRGPYPLIVFSHGGPHAATGYSFDFKQQFFAAHGYFVLDTNFRSSTGYGDAFKWATWGEWGTKDGEDVVSGIDYVIHKYPIDSKRVGHTGHSYGGFMTNWLITQYPDRFAAAVTGAGISNWMSDYGTADIYRTKETEFFGTPWDKAARDRMIHQSPLAYADRVKTPTLFIHGEVDHRVPYTEGEQMYFALRRRGIPAKMIRYADQPHGISGHWNNVHRMINELQWWEKYLKNSGGRSQKTEGDRF